MKYLCLIYEDERIMSGLPAADAEAVMEQYFAFTRDLAASGRFVDGQELQPVAAATTVRIRDGQLVTFDGPFCETKEQLGGYYLVEARDRQEAIAIAAQIPAARTGSIEVRPVIDHGGQGVA